MDRKRYNRESNNAQYDVYKLQDLTIDQEYLYGKSRDMWAVISDPPYIKAGGQVQIASNPLRVNIGGTIAFDSEFFEINAPPVSNYALLDYTPNVNNYLTVHYNTLEDVSSTRTTYKNTSLTYYAYRSDSFQYQWKLAAPIEPQITGNIAQNYNITKDLNNIILFATNQSSPEYSITLSTNVASITSDDIGSGSVIVYNGVNDLFNFTVDTFSYSLSLTGIVSGQLFTLSGLATQINTLAFAQNVLLTNPIAFAIDGENKIRITSPRDATPIAQKKVLISAGTANTLLGLSENDISIETPVKSAENIVDEINLATSPEVTATVFGGNRVKIKAGDPAGYITLMPVNHSVYSTLGMTEGTVFGAEQIDFTNDVILATAHINTSGALVLDTNTRTHGIRVVDGNDGWKETFDFSFGSGDIIYTETFTLASHTYVVGSNELEVHTNGKYLHIGKDFDEVGVVGTRSTQFTVYEVRFGDTIEAKIPSSSPSNFPTKIVKSDGNVVVLGFTELNFAPEFTVTLNSFGGADIKASLISGAVMNHAFNHEFGGNDELNVNNLTGLLLQPQKTNFYVEGALLYSRPGINLTGAGYTISDNTSGYVTINIPETKHTNIDGDAIIKLGYTGGSVFDSIVVQATDNSNLWQVTINDFGQLETELLSSGTPSNYIIQSENGSLWLLDIEDVFGSGEIKTSLQVSGFPLNFSIRAPNTKAYGIRVENDGTVYTLDPITEFIIERPDTEPVYRLDSHGIAYFNIFNVDATSGDIAFLPAASDTSGGIALVNTSGVLDMLVSNGTVWRDFFQAARKAVFTQALPLATWTFTHSLNTDDYIVTVKDLLGNVIIPNSISCGFNTITVTFTLPTTGKVVIIG